MYVLNISTFWQGECEICGVYVYMEFANPAHQPGGLIAWLVAQMDALSMQNLIADCFFTAK